MCTADGCPIAVEVFEGNTADPLTLATQIDKLKQRFHLQRVVMVGDRGLLTSARIEQTLRPAGLHWITALRAPAIKQLAATGGPLQPSLFDDRDMAEITSPDYPGERLVVCKNPLLTGERARKRAELLAATENELARIAARVQRARSPLRGAAAIGQAVGAVLGRRHIAKHFQISIGEDAFSFAQNPFSIAAEAALDGIYVIRTNLPAEHSDAAATVRAQKSQRRRARLSLAEDRRSRTASGVPLDRAAGARARLALHVGLLSAMAHAPVPRPDAVRRARSGRPCGAARRAGGQGRALTGGATHGRPQTHRPGRWPTAPGAQLPHPARRSRHAYPQCRPLRARSPHRYPRHPYPYPAPCLRSARTHAHRADRPMPSAANYLNGLPSKPGKVRVKRQAAKLC
jgi:hypothetical protein